MLIWIRLLRGSFDTRMIAIYHYRIYPLSSFKNLRLSLENLNDKAKSKRRAGIGRHRKTEKDLLQEALRMNQELLGWIFGRLFSDDWKILRRRVSSIGHAVHQKTTTNKNAQEVTWFCERARGSSSIGEDKSCERLIDSRYPIRSRIAPVSADLRPGVIRWISA